MVTADIENNVNRVLKLIKEDGKAKGNSEKGSEVVELVVDFLKQYQYLYELHNQLKGDLREKIQGRKRNSSLSSSSSDSGPDYIWKGTGSESRIPQLELISKQNEDKSISHKKELRENEDDSAAHLTEPIIYLQMDMDHLRAENGELQRELEFLKIQKTEPKIAEYVILVKHLREKLRNNFTDKQSGLQKQLPSLTLELKMERETPDRLKEEHKRDLERRTEEIKKDFKMLIKHNEQIYTPQEIFEQPLGEKQDEKSQVHDTELKEMQIVIAKVANIIFTGFYMAAEKLEETCGGLLVRICNAANEIKEVKKGIIFAKFKVNEWKKGVLYFHGRVEDLKIQINTLNYEKDQLETERVREEFRRFQTERTKREVESLVGHLQKVILERDRRLRDMAEEKREVIRQLCLWSDHLRCRCDCLKETLSKLTARRV